MLHKNTNTLKVSDTDVNIHRVNKNTQRSPPVNKEVCPLLCLALSLLIHIYYDEIWMTELLWTFFCCPDYTCTASLQKKKSENWPKVCPPDTCVYTHFSALLKFLCGKGLLKKLCLAGGRFYRGQAGRHSENCINVKQIKMWFFQTRPFHHILLWSEDNKHLCFAIQCLSGWIIISRRALVNAEQFQENINPGTPRSEKKGIFKYMMWKYSHIKFSQRVKLKWNDFEINPFLNFSLYL